MKAPADPGAGGTSPVGSAAAAWAALGVGLAYAAISAYWATGGTWLLDTVGGAFARLGHSACPAVLAGLWAVVLAKTVAAGLPVAVSRGLARPSLRGALRRLAWLAGWVLAAYGLVLTVPGLAIQAGLLHAGTHADRRALAWHAYLWDPWFLVWGLLIIATLYVPPGHRRTTGGPPFLGAAERTGHPAGGRGRTPGTETRGTSSDARRA
jgi:hypothetical protein